MAPKVRDAARQQAIKDHKEKKRAAVESKKAQKSATDSKNQTQRIVGKQAARGMPPKNQPKTR